MGIVGCLALSLGPVAWAAPPRRARPPQFPPSVQDAFFPDARQQLVGPRPQTGAAKAAPAAPSNTELAETVDSTAQGWSKLITAEVLEDEIKACQIQLAAAVQTPLKFKGGAYQQARQHFNLLATLFAITAEYDGDVRWKREAAAMRDRLSRAGANCKVGTDQTFQEAKARLEDLDGLVRGSALADAAGAAEFAWPAMADRQQLMKRLEVAVEEDLSRWTAQAPDFSRHLERASHDAQLVAALAEVIMQAGYDSADDETYRQHATAMQQAAIQVRDAAQQTNYDQARAAVGEIKKACGNCHEGFRD